MSSLKKSVISNIQALMQKRGITKSDGTPNQSKLAKLAGLDQKTINNLLNPKNPASPRVDTLERVAKALKASAWQLLVHDFPFDGVSGALSRPKISPTGFALLQVYETSDPAVQAEIAGYARYILDRSHDSPGGLAAPVKSK